MNGLLQTPTECPSCHITWLSGKSMPTDLLMNPHNNISTCHEAMEAASHYGWTQENDKRFGVHYMGIEIQGQYDGILYWRCNCCGHKAARWSWYDPDIPNYMWLNNELRK
jgi:hypothetical protein